MKLNFRWFLGRDLRQLTDTQLKEAVSTLSPQARLSRASRLAWENILDEVNRREQIESNQNESN